MQKLLIVLLASIFLASCSKAIVSQHEMQGNGLKSNAECEACWDSAYYTLDVLFKLATEGGIFTGCVDFCNEANAGQICMMACTVLGEEAFLWVLVQMDLDPVYYCQLAGICPIADCNGDCADITGLKVTPHKAPVGTEFNVPVSFKVNENFNGTATYWIYVQLEGQDMVLENTALLVQPQMGVYNYNFSIPSDADSWQPGNYSCLFQVCEGQCDYPMPTHPYTATWASKTFWFEMTLDN